MESKAEVVSISVKRQCSSCKVVKDDDQFLQCSPKWVKCSCDVVSFFKTCEQCRESKKKYRDKVKASKVIVWSASSTTAADFSPVPLTTFLIIDCEVDCPPPPGIGL